MRINLKWEDKQISFDSRIAVFNQDTNDRTVLKLIGAFDEIVIAKNYNYVINTINECVEDYAAQREPRFMINVEL